MFDVGLVILSLIKVTLVLPNQRTLIFLTEVKWQEWLSDEVVAKRRGLKEIEVKMRQTRLPLFGHVEREKEGDVLKLVESLQIWRLLE